MVPHGKTGVQDPRRSTKDRHNFDPVVPAEKIGQSIEILESTGVYCCIILRHAFSELM